MLCGITHIFLLELVNDSPGNSIDHLHFNSLWILFRVRNKSEHVRIEILVKEGTVLAEHSGQKVVRLARNTCRLVLRLHINDFKGGIKFD